MKTLKLTAKDFKYTDSHYKEYCGKADVSDYEGNIEIEGGLSYVFFKKLSAKGYILAEAGTSIEAGEDIKAGKGIEAGWCIKAGWCIEAGTGIEAGTSIEAGWGIKAGMGIKAGEGIKAGTSIKAGWGIEAGWCIEAGKGIEAGLSITCKLVLSFSIKAFAGICTWRELNGDEEKTITCGRKEGDGIVEYGILKEIGIPNEEPKTTGCGDIIEINGVKYKKL